MSTRIVFGGGHDVVVTKSVEEVKEALQKGGTGRRLIKFEREGKGGAQTNPRIYVNRGEVAYIEEVRPEPQPPEEPHALQFATTPGPSRNRAPD
jgi:hypothetical protein